MALAFGAVVYDGPRCKIFTVTALDNDAPANLTVTFLTSGMTDFQGAAPPTEAHIVVTASAADAAWTAAITAMSATACTFRKVQPVGGMGANSKTYLITLRVPRGIGA